ncbi:MAG: hypothetical protein O3C54_07295 [Proteobacteria bacterium]|nr:hypothetical protein [Pseudomonadota bacterium]
MTSHSKIAMFGSSYAACFYLAREYFIPKIDFYCSRNSLIHQIIDVDSQSGEFKADYSCNPDQIDQLKNIYLTSISDNTYNSPSDYSHFVINTRLVFNINQYLFPSPYFCRNDQLSTSLIKEILLNMRNNDVLFGKTLDTILQFGEKLNQWNNSAQCHVIPEPLEIEPVTVDYTENDFSVHEACIARLCNKITVAFYECFGLNLLIQPSQTLAYLHTKKEYCTLTQDRNWRNAISDPNGIRRTQGVQESDENIRFLPPRNRHRNVLFAKEFSPIFSLLS